MNRTLITSFFINSQQNEGSQLSKRLNISLSKGIQSSYAAISLPKFQELRPRKYDEILTRHLENQSFLRHDRLVEADSEQNIDFGVLRSFF